MSSQEFEDRQAEIDHEDDLFNAGHRACAGCGPALAMRYLTDATGENTIVTGATGCMEVVSSPYPESAWGTSYIHDVFANAAGVASGVETAYRALEDNDDVETMDHDDVNFVVAAGDGATFDIGIRSLSGMMERGHDVLYVAYDNEAYMNTGIQRSSSTPLGASTTTTPAGTESEGEDIHKKDMVSIALAHGCPYVATASISEPRDFKEKVERALEIDGPKYIQVLTPCPIGWNSETDQTVELGRLAVETGIQPLVEFVDGELEDVNTVRDRKPVEEYLEKQGRFAHLFEDEEGQDVIEEFQSFVDERAAEFGIDA